MSGSVDLAPGTVTVAEMQVAPKDLASAYQEGKDDAFPPVLATPRMIALMEVACGRALTPLLKPGQLSVGVNINATHSAATLEGVLVTAEATYKGQEGKLFAFEVVAKDPAGVIGKCTHTRAIIDADRLMAGAQKRVSGPAN